MNAVQKEQISKARCSGESYSSIADTLGLSVNTVKSFCRRNGITKDNVSGAETIKENKGICVRCGKKLIFSSNAKPKRFCDDKCRISWWNHHRNLLRHKREHNLTCAHCGASFDYSDIKTRKYCSHPCYIADRFYRPLSVGEVGTS